MSSSPQDKTRVDGLQFETELEAELYCVLDSIIKFDEYPLMAKRPDVFALYLSRARTVRDKARKERGGKADV